MLKKIGGFVILGGLVFLWLLRIIHVNRQYPNPEVRIAEEGEELRCENYSFKLTAFEWHDGSIIDTILPGYIPLYTDYINNIAYPVEKERVLLATIEIKKLEETQEPLDLRTTGSFEMGAWGNDWSWDLFFALNGENGHLVDLNLGESKEIVLPAMMYEIQFQPDDWKNIDENYIDIVMAFYPVKSILRADFG